ncbi:MAG: MFS transporter [Methanocorpusculum sp.]|nr:MFS transporter [Methanocorpusculum sp.]
MHLSRITVYLGAFAAMALSNAVVPVLALITQDAALQGALYSAYFLGAFFMVFPAGWLSDKFGRASLIRIGLAGTFLSAILLWFLAGDPLSAVVLRLVEGLFTGMFVSAAVSYVNSEADHRKLSGIYLALLNVGMVAGLLLSGVLAVIHPYAGVLFFGVLTGCALIAGIFFRDSTAFVSETVQIKKILSITREHKWLFVSLFIFTGTTGIVTSMYPEMSGYSADISGVVTALMSISTAVCVYAASRFAFWNSLGVIRKAAFILAISVPIVFFTPAGMILAGAAYGVIAVAVLHYIAETHLPQGVTNGLNMMIQYAGMAVLPFIAGVVVMPAGYFLVFVFAGIAVLAGGLLVVRCPCYTARLKKE